MRPEQIASIFIAGLNLRDWPSDKITGLWPVLWPVVHPGPMGILSSVA